MLNFHATVFVVDSDESVRVALERLIRRSGFAVETFTSPKEFLARPRLLAPSCLVLDLSFSELDGFEVQRRITADRRETPIIVISDRADIPLTVLAMRAGAVDFFMKPLCADTLLSAIGQAISRSEAVLIQERELANLRSRHDSLTVREREVMACVVAGQLNKHVGAALGISEITVKAHRARAMQKMGAGSLAELVSMTLKLNATARPSQGVDRYRRARGDEPLLRKIASH